MLKYAEDASPFYAQASALVQEAYDYFKANFPLESMHEISCFVELYEYLKECDLQNADGTFDVTWDWGVFPEQWAVSKNWWKADIIIQNMTYAREF